MGETAKQKTNRKQRLDTLLVEQGWCDTRQQAQRMIRAGEVQVNHQVVDKPGTAILIESEIQVKQKSPYVSRGGEKLAKALQAFSIQVSDRICLDGGISTGGFTDCLLQQGAARVYGIDVGYGQVAWSLRQDPRVILRERTNLRHLIADDLYEPGAARPNLGVIDVSFISLTKVLSAFWQLLQPPREALLLVKPQFEVGKEKVGKGGVVRDAQDQAEAIWRVVEIARELSWHDLGLTYSPITGPAGNIEYLLWLSMVTDEIAPLTLEQIQQLTQEAKATLNRS
jgi:23S rRNA (cytidine1920-2'-O)/16S rRNA (cytidine1409-2'-O)-methyltransferase